MKPKFYYHFTGDTLRNGEPLPPIGKWLEVVGEIIPCEHGLHASAHPFDALSFAPGNRLHRVTLGDKIVPHGNPVDKVVSNRRKIVASINAEDLLRRFARRVALDVLPLWKDSPAIVREYLETGDESKRAAASAAASAAESAAASAAAWAAAWAAARAAAWAAAWAARTAATQKYRQWFLEMVEAEFQAQGGQP